MGSISENETRNDRHALVRWSEHLGGLSQEESVVVVSEADQAIRVCTSRPLKETTPVYIWGARNSGNGIVRSCFPDGRNYIVLIEWNREEMLRFGSSNIDPGVFAIDGFLTEEQEDKILESLGDEDASTFDQDPDSVAALGESNSSRGDDECAAREALPASFVALAAATMLPIQ